MRYPGITLLSVTALAFAFVFVTPRHPARMPFTQEAYVWQQHWNGAVTDAISRRPAELNRIAVLAAVIRFQGDSPQVTKVAIPPSALTAQRVPWSPVFRLSNSSTAFTSGTIDPELQILERCIRELPPPGNGPEVQLDFDCPSSRLSGYAMLLTKLKQRVPGQQWTITVLPSWLKSRQWPALLDACDSFVLQVHSLELPESDKRFVDLCDIAQSKNWVEAASQYRRPFRVALPTYRSDVLFDRAGKVTGVSSETDPVCQYHSRSVAWSRPETLLPLVQWIRRTQPMVRGIIWFRLPVESDRKNWSRATFTAVLQGRLPVRKLEIRRVEERPSFYRLELCNLGEQDELWPGKIQLEGTRQPTEAADGLGAYQLFPADDGLLFQLSSEAAAEVPTLAAGKRFSIGWIRTAEPAEALKFTLN